MADPLLDLPFVALDIMISDAKSAQFKEVEELTDNERIAIAVFSGAEMLSAFNESGNLELRTRWPIGIQKINGKFEVSEAPRRKKH